MVRCALPFAIFALAGCAQGPVAAALPAAGPPAATLPGRILAIRPIDSTRQAGPHLAAFLASARPGPAEPGCAEFIIEAGGRIMSIVQPNPDALAPGQAVRVVRSARTEIARAT